MSSRQRDESDKDVLSHQHCLATTHKAYFRDVDTPPGLYIGGKNINHPQIRNNTTLLARSRGNVNK